jgi:DNA-directed RNA polymerase subunit delta
MRAVDAAYQVLQESGQPMPVHDFLDEVAKRAGQEPDARILASIYSDINLDVRFTYRGDGLWALRDWTGQPGQSVSGTGGRDRPRSDIDAAEDTEEEGW